MPTKGKIAKSDGYETQYTPVHNFMLANPNIII